VNNTQPLPTFPDLRGTYSGPSTSDRTGLSDQITLQIEQQVTDDKFSGVVLPGRHKVPLKQIQQQIGPNFPWVILPDGRVFPSRRAQMQAGNNFQGTLRIAGPGMTFTVFGTFGNHGQFRAAAVDGDHILTLRGTFLANADGTATIMMGYRLKMGRKHVDTGTVVLTGTPGMPPILPTPLF
jgi:hypothetical protein